MGEWIQLDNQFFSTRRCSIELKRFRDEAIFRLETERRRANLFSAMTLVAGLIGLMPLEMLSPNRGVSSEAKHIRDLKIKIM